MFKKRNSWAALFQVLAIFFLLLSGDAGWAFKNACPDCQTVIENQELTECPQCDKVINKCLACGHVNPIKNDVCENCNANLAGFRVTRTIDKETRDNLRLGDSPRALIEVELGQIKNLADQDGMSSQMAARKIQLLSQMGWWSKVNTVAEEFSTQFPNSDQDAEVTAHRVIALRHLGFLALEAKDREAAQEYLKTALSLDPKDAASLNLLQMAGGAKAAKQKTVKTTKKGSSK